MLCVIGTSVLFALRAISVLSTALSERPDTGLGWDSAL